MIMNIYIVSHYYNNGESYEDYREYEDHSYYSTFELANTFYWDKVTSDYEGKYVLKSVVLDTQEINILEESEYLTCHSQWDDYYNQENPEPDYDYKECDGYYEPDPMESCKEAWDYIEMEEHVSELEVERRYLNEKNINYQEWEAVNKEIEERKNAILVESLNETLDELLTI